MNYRKGSILLYTLVFFVFFSVFFERIVRIKVRDIQRENSVSIIRNRLDIEAELVKYYRGTLANEWVFTLHNSRIESWREDDCVYVIVSGDIRMRFKYDIIEDGSFIHSHWEE